MRLACLVGSAALAMVGCNGAVDAPSQQTVFEPGPCAVGIYGQSAPFMVVARRDSGFHYAFSDGRRGHVGDATMVECGARSVRIGASTILRQRAIKITNTAFDADGTLLSGQLIEPASANAHTPLVVLAHGSEETGWIESAVYPYQLVGRGVSVFVYDKRGTGRSSGEYSQNFPQLADDLVNASAEAQRLADGRFGRFGLLGFSQGGWIVPLAADRANAEFLGIGYGLVIDILEEDAAQVVLELREAGYGDEVIAKAKSLTDVTARLAVSMYTDGLEDLDRLRALYSEEDWFPLVRGGFSGVLLGMSTDELRVQGIPMFDRLNIDWSLKPMDVLRDVNVPLLWVLAENDREAPISTTLERLQNLRQEGKEITVYLFPETDHGMWEFTQAADGTRTYTRVTDRYYDLLADWAKGPLLPPYADSLQQ